MGRKGRSPNHPRLPLREAIERTAKIHRAERTHRVDKEAVAKDLGYGGLNGASTTLIGTLKSYGLLHEDKEGVRVTEDAVTILRAPEGDPDKAEALHRAAFTPRVFSELRETYGNDPSELPSETTLQYRLEKRGFLEKAASEVIRTYRDNLEFVSEENAEYTEAETVDEQHVEAEMQHQETLSPASQRILSAQDIQNVMNASIPDRERPSEASRIILSFKPSRTSKAVIELTGDVTQDAIEKLKQLLEIHKDSFPEKVEAAEQMRSANEDTTAEKMSAPE